MDWHRRYTQQARWTRDLRTYLFEKAGVIGSTRVHGTAPLVLEVGCGTGAILSELPERLAPHGLDIDAAALAQCQVHAPSARLVQGNALQLPYSAKTFDIVYCHFLLLWLQDPLSALAEMKRVAKPGAGVIAFAEPDYSTRIDEPRELVPVGQWQAEALRKQGADPSLGGRLADLFFRAGIQIVETGPIQNAEGSSSPPDWETEWAVIEADLAGLIPEADLHKLKDKDRQAREHGERVLYVPTYFAWGQA
jgi:ubiquinone/menaquinone biosynthesis C-methylase UbiE